MYVKRNNEARSCSHCCCGKAVSITQPDYVSIALVIQHEMCMRHIVICGLTRSTVFFHVFMVTPCINDINPLQSN